MSISFTAPSAQWFAASSSRNDPTPNAGAIHFDGLNGTNSFTILGSDLVTPVGHGFLIGERIYTHFGFPETPNAGEWLFFKVDLDDRRIVVHSPLLEGDRIVLPVTGTFAPRTIEGVRLQKNSEEDSYSFYYTKPDGEECCVMTTSPGNWMSDHLAPVLANVSTFEDFLLISFSPRTEGEDFPVEDFLYTIVANRHTGTFLGQGLRREYHSMSARFDSYIELGVSSLGPVSDKDWWPVFYHDLWRHVLHNTRQPQWNFDRNAITVTYATGQPQRFVLS